MSKQRKPKLSPKEAAAARTKRNHIAAAERVAARAAKPAAKTGPKPGLSASAKSTAASARAAAKPSAPEGKAPARPAPAANRPSNQLPPPKNAQEVLERARMLAQEDEDAFARFYHDVADNDAPVIDDSDDDVWRYDDEFVDLSEDTGERTQFGEVIAVAAEDVAPLIAIVGRPNVGKSRMYNRMTKSRFAIVEDMPGVTRDRQYGDGEWDDRVFQVVDTGGFEPDSTDELLRQMREQAEIAIHEADIVFFMVDARAGVTNADREIASMLRQVNRPVFLLANKIDNEEQMLLASEFYELGVHEVFPISAEHGTGYNEVMEQIADLLPPKVERPDDDTQIRVAVVGRPNAGKSTFINKLLGEDRLLTSNIPGTTRDAINTILRTDTNEYLFIDTAGIRKKKRIYELVEKYSVVQAFKALDRADIAIIMLDATEPFSSQDQRIAGLAHDKGCGMIFVLNKWDLVKKDHKTADEYVRKVRETFKFASYAPVVTISAATGQRVHKLLELINDVHHQYTRRISTSDANFFLAQALRRRSPPQSSSKQMRFYFASQVAARPPTFMFAVNNPGLLHFSYERFLINNLRECFGFKGVPIKVFYRGKNAKD